MSQIAFTDPVRTSDALHDAVRDPDTHVVVAHVSHSTVMGRKRTKGGDGLTWVDRPILADSSYEALADDGFDFDGFLSRFLASGSNKGLFVSLRDPRVVVPVFKALETAVENGRLVSPIILDAEVLPGPAGTCRRWRACALTPPRTRISTSGATAEPRSRRTTRARPRDPSTWTTGRDSPSRRRTARATSCRSIPSVSSARRRFASRARYCRSASRTWGRAVRARKISPPRKKNPAAGLAFPFQSAYAWHQRQRAMMHQRLRGAKVKMFGNATGDEAMMRLPGFFTPAARARYARMRGAALAAANATSSVAAVLGKSGVGRRRLAQMDFEIMAIAEAEDERARESKDAPKTKPPRDARRTTRRAPRGASLTTARTDGTRARIS